jgi:hypothetical protein
MFFQYARYWRRAIRRLITLRLTLRRFLRRHPLEIAIKKLRLIFWVFCNLELLLQSIDLPSAAGEVEPSVKALRGPWVWCRRGSIITMILRSTTGPLAEKTFLRRIPWPKNCLYGLRAQTSLWFISKIGNLDSTFSTISKRGSILKLNKIFGS